MSMSTAMAQDAREDRMDVLDRNSRDSVIERRNFFIGLWAGQLMGYEGDDLALYAGEIMASDLAEPGPQDMIARIVEDFAANGITVTEMDIGSRLSQTERLVRAELLSTD
ncbi:MAG: ATPase inhibitor subunit zeta [Beijerinckiaceae bacterium]|nr:ATPase inhibitor subunit zeta [Beijerinckiaceae bacterium]